VTPELEYEIAYSKLTTDFIETVLSDADFMNETRIRLTTTYARLNIEHQSTMRILVEQNHRGSAFALLRPQIEACFRGLWVQQLASEIDVEAIRKDGAEPFPKFKKMAKDLDDALSADGLFTGIATGWQTMSGFTHSGLQHLSRFSLSSGVLAPKYSDEDTCRVLRISASAALLMLPPVFRMNGMTEKAASIEAWLDAKLGRS
jgi:hypothetical protein